MSDDERVAEIRGRLGVLLPHASKLGVQAMADDMQYLLGRLDAAEAEVSRLRRIAGVEIDGAKACLTGEPIGANPWPEPGEDWHQWRRGWDRIDDRQRADAAEAREQALREAADELADALRAVLKYATVDCPGQRLSWPRAEAAVDRYTALAAGPVDRRPDGGGQ